MRKRTAEEKPAAIKAVLSSAGAVFGRSAPGAARVIPALWRGRGFSDRVVQALTDYGIDAPERLWPRIFDPEEALISTGDVKKPNLLCM